MHGVRAGIARVVLLSTSTPAIFDTSAAVTTASQVMPGFLQWSRDLLQQTMGTVRSSLLSGLVVVRQHKTAFVNLQIAYYGTVLTSMALAAVYPHLQKDALQRTDAALKAYSVGRWVVAAYDAKTGSVPLAAWLTFTINLLVGAFTTITLPSLLIPFSGIAFSAFRAREWGYLFSPIGPDVSIPHLFTLLFEGQAYVLAALGGWIQGRGIVDHVRSWSEDKGKDGSGKTGWLRWPGYADGVRQTLQLYGPIALVLLGSSIWEAIEVIHWGSKSTKH